MIRRLAAWWRRTLDREMHGRAKAAVLDSWRRELAWTERELHAHTAAVWHIDGGDTIRVAAELRTEHLHERQHDLRALIAEHA